MPARMDDFISLLHQKDNRPSDNPQLEKDDNPPDKVVMAEPVDPVRGVDCDGAMGDREGERYGAAVVELADVGV